MQEYKPNSHRSKELKTDREKKKVKQVVKGPVKVKRKGELKKIMDVFLPEDVTNAKTYIVFDVLIPSIKDFLYESMGTILYGEEGRQKRTSSTKTSYRRFYDEKNNRARDTRRNRSNFEYDDVVLDSRGEAEEVLAEMDELISIYGFVSVADLYDMVGITQPYTYNKYGWTSLNSASVTKLRGGGYLLNLPKALPLD
ncbi:hypothetical protein [Anaerostipes sp. PC18]|uniref:hypothetical protein n=1 Tax=Anaerostipes sp. PC18 TaxID=3036926 RepID=UPI00308A86D4|nr:hypothetical protein P8F77_10360 [Anaerostipes sp. PC18]